MEKQHLTDLKFAVATRIHNEKKLSTAMKKIFCLHTQWVYQEIKNSLKYWNEKDCNMDFFQRLFSLRRFWFISTCNLPEFLSPRNIFKLKYLSIFSNIKVFLLLFSRSTTFKYHPFSWMNTAVEWERDSSPSVISVRSRTTKVSRNFREYKGERRRFNGDEERKTSWRRMARSVCDSFCLVLPQLWKN